MTDSLIGESFRAEPDTSHPHAGRHPRRVSSDQRTWSVWATVAAVVCGILFALPLLWVIAAAFNSQAGFLLAWPKWSLANFTSLGSADMISLLRSFEFGFISMIVATVPGVLGGYSLARRRIPLGEGVMICVLFLTAVPISVVIIPLYEALSDWNLLTLWPAAVFTGVITLPFTLWIVRSAVHAIPIELEDAARVEGANLLQVIGRVTLRLAAPGIVAAGFFSFSAGWSAFLVPLVIVSSSSEQPGQIALYGYLHSGITQYGQIAAFSILYSVPVVLLYLVVSRLISGGFAFGGAIKG